MMKYMQSLHNHTIVSDGEMTHCELLETAKRNGYSTIAFADHDAVMPLSVIGDLKLNPVDGMRWISAIEIASALPEDAIGEPSGDFHIVGLFVDPTNEALLAHCRRAQNGRIDRMKTIVALLRKAGFVISEEECMNAAGGTVVALPHIVSAINSHRENNAIIESMRKNMERDSASDPALRETYLRMMERGVERYPYKLFLSSNAYMKGLYATVYKVGMDESVSLIRNAGGLAIVAHYTTARKNISHDMLESYLRDKRLDGIETLYGIQTGGKEERDEIVADRARLVEIAERTGCLVSGGADAHKEQDLKYFAEAADLGGQTFNLGEKIIEKSGVATTWSSM